MTWRQETHNRFQQRSHRDQVSVSGSGRSTLSLRRIEEDKNEEGKQVDGAWADCGSAGSINVLH
jgi:hypothetical protein